MTMKSDELGDLGRNLSSGKDEEDLVVAQLINDLNSIKETQMQYGMPAIGDLFRGRTSDIQETVNSLYYMLKQRVQDIEARNDFRQKVGRAENSAADAKQQLARCETKLEACKKEADKLKDKVKQTEQRHKEELAKVTSERDELIKAVTKVEHKEAHYKHEIRQKELVIAKLQDQLKSKLADTTTKARAANKENQAANAAPQLAAAAKILPSNEVKFSKMSGDNDLSLSIQRSHEEMYKRIQQENHELKDCLKLLQREMFDIVKLKSDIYLKRFKAEHFDANDAQAVTSEELLKHEINKIKEQLFNLNFEEQGREIIHQFRLNFSKLKQFMGDVDKGLAELRVFSQSNHVDSVEDDKAPTSVVQLKELLRNYEGIVESQH